MSNNIVNYLEYIDVATGTIRRKRTEGVLRNEGDILLTDNHIVAPKGSFPGILNQTQNNLQTSQNEQYYFQKVLEQSINDPITPHSKYLEKTRKRELAASSPSKVLDYTNFLHEERKRGLTDNTQLITRNTETIVERPAETSTPSKIVIIYENAVNVENSKTEDNTESGVAENIQDEELELRKPLSYLSTPLPEPENQVITLEVELEENELLPVELTIIKPENQVITLEVELKEEVELLQIKNLLDELKKSIARLELAEREAKLVLCYLNDWTESNLVKYGKAKLSLYTSEVKKGRVPELRELEKLEKGLSGMAKAIKQEILSRKLKQIETSHNVEEEPVKAKKSFWQKIKSKFSSSISDNQPEFKISELLLPSNSHDKDIGIDLSGTERFFDKVYSDPDFGIKA